MAALLHTEGAELHRLLMMYNACAKEEVRKQEERAKEIAEAEKAKQKAEAKEIAKAKAQEEAHAEPANDLETKVDKAVGQNKAEVPSGADPKVLHCQCG